MCQCTAEGLRKVTVVSFGLFGDQGVFRREATGAAQIVGSRFGHGSVVVRFNTKTGGGATIKSLAATLPRQKRWIAIPTFFFSSSRRTARLTALLSRRGGS
jgi:hypothetical protein